MGYNLTNLRACALSAVGALFALGAAGVAHADSPSLEFTGAVQLDYIQDFNRVDPNWDATLRPSRIPTTSGEFGTNGQSILSVRQSKFGVIANQDVDGQDLYIKFDFDLFGQGSNEGETTFHLADLYGKWGPLLVGYTYTNWMDADVFPDVIDYWGPNGMVYLRNPQIRLTYKTGPHEFAGAIESPSNDVDPGQLRLIDPALEHVQGVEKIPDFTAHYRYDGGWGHLQLSGILRQVSFETLGTPDSRPRGSKLGWGVNLTSNIKIVKSNVFHIGAVYGEGIASYMNDGGVDLAPGGRPPMAQPQALFGLVAYLDHKWTEQFSSAVGYSQTRVTNTSLQSRDAFKQGQYASMNLLWRPDKHIMMGTEFIWGERQDNNGATGDDSRIQFSFKYSFSSKDFFR